MICSDHSINKIGELFYTLPINNVFYADLSTNKIIINHDKHGVIAVVTCPFNAIPNVLHHHQIIARVSNQHVIATAAI